MRKVAWLGLAVTLAACGGQAAAASAPIAAGVAEWPAAAAQLAPPYPGDTVTSAFSGATDGRPDGQQAAMISFTTHDTAQRVVDFYATHARGAGLKQAGTMATPDTRMVTFSDPASGRSVTVQTSLKEGETQVLLIVGMVSPTNGG